MLGTLWALASGLKGIFSWVFGFTVAICIYQIFVHTLELIAWLRKPKEKK